MGADAGAARGGSALVAKACSRRGGGLLEVRRSRARFRLAHLRALLGAQVRKVGSPTNFDSMLL